MNWLLSAAAAPGTFDANISGAVVVACYGCYCCLFNNKNTSKHRAANFAWVEFSNIAIRTAAPYTPMQRHFGRR